jgi:hypothetical protein
MSGQFCLSCEPSPDFFLDSVRRIRGDDSCTVNPAAVEKLSRCEPLTEGAAMDFNMAIIPVVAEAKKYNLCLIGQKVLADLAAAMGCKYYPDLAMAIAQEAGGGEKKIVTVIPAGGYIFPIISEPFHLLD